MNYSQLLYSLEAQLTKAAENTREARNVAETWRDTMVCSGFGDRLSVNNEKMSHA